MTRRAQAGLYYLPEAALTLRVSWVVFEKALYHPRVRPQLSHYYRRSWTHPRRLRVLTDADLTVLVAHLLAHSLPRHDATRRAKRRRR